MIAHWYALWIDLSKRFLHLQREIAEREQQARSDQLRFDAENVHLIELEERQFQNYAKEVSVFSNKSCLSFKQKVLSVDPRFALGLASDFKING